MYVYVVVGLYCNGFGYVVGYDEVVCWDFLIVCV